MIIELTSDETAAIAYIRKLPQLYPDLNVIWDQECISLTLRRQYFESLELKPYRAFAPDGWQILTKPTDTSGPYIELLRFNRDYLDSSNGAGLFALITRHFQLLRPVWRKAPPKTPLCPDEDILPGAKPNQDLARFCSELRKLGLLAEVDLHKGNPKSGPQRILIRDIGLARCSIVINDDGDAKFCNKDGIECDTLDGVSWPLKSAHLPAAVVVYLLHTAGGAPLPILIGYHGAVLHQVYGFD